jgi:hypothetical protein
MTLLRSYYDDAPTELFGWRSYGAVWMALIRSCLDGAHTELLGCRSYGAVWMALLWSYPIILVLYPRSMSVCSNFFR